MKVSLELVGVGQYSCAKQNKIPSTHHHFDSCSPLSQRRAEVKRVVGQVYSFWPIILG